MPEFHKGFLWTGVLSVLILLLMAANLQAGSVDIPAAEVWRILSGNLRGTVLGLSSCGKAACRCA